MATTLRTILSEMAGATKRFFAYPETTMALFAAAFIFLLIYLAE